MFDSNLYKANRNNHNVALAFELATVLLLHESSGAVNNPDLNYIKLNQSYYEYYNRVAERLPFFKLNVITNRARKAFLAYASSLMKNHGITLSNISEVYHTPNGISEFCSDSLHDKNPHDLIIKTYCGRVHGASLKYSSGTLRNQTANSFDDFSNRNNIATNIKDVWDHWKCRLGIDHMTRREINDIRHHEDIVFGNKQAKIESALHHKLVIDSSNSDDVIRFVRSIINKYTLEYDYVIASKCVSTPINNHPITMLLNDLTRVNTVLKTNRVLILDQDNKHLFTFEHRPTHGPFNSIQVNTKYGSGNVIREK